jgi:hypothetical protein
VPFNFVQMVMIHDVHMNYDRDFELKGISSRTNCGSYGQRDIPATASGAMAVLQRACRLPQGIILYRVKS